MPTAILDVDLADPAWSRADLGGYARALVLLRVAGRPVGAIRVPVPGGELDGDAVRAAAQQVLSWPVQRERLAGWIGRPPSSDPPPSATVAVCTRERPEDLERCLRGLMAMPDDGQEYLIIDNAPATDRTRELVSRFPRVRYLLEEAPGLNRARNRALREARHEVVAFIDDDAVPDPRWLRGLLSGFDDPLVLCVTGLTMPLELETEAQECFERMSSFNRGFERRSFDLVVHDPLAVGRVGAGVNMALRRSAVDTIGPFLEALDAGTPTRSGGDHEMFARILMGGYRIVYEPSALNWHRHRRSWEATRETLYGYGVGVYAVFTHHLLEHRESGVIRLAWRWFRDSQARDLARALLGRPSAPPLRLVLSELAGCFVGPWAYLRSRRTAPPVGQGLRP